MRSFSNGLLIELLTLVLLFMVALLLRRFLNNWWPAWLHPLDILLPVVLIVTAQRVGTISVRPIFLWLLVIWFVLGLVTSWRTFQGRKPVPYKNFILVFWRLSDLYWVGAYALAAIISVVVR